MKTTRIDIEGPNGNATIARSDMTIEIIGRRGTRVIETRDGRSCLGYRRFRWAVNAGNYDEIDEIARRLQRALDGYEGTNGDVADYRRVLAAFED